MRSTIMLNKVVTIKKLAVQAAKPWVKKQKQQRIKKVDLTRPLAIQGIITAMIKSPWQRQ